MARNHDAAHTTTMAKARAKHTGATADAADAHEKATAKTEQALLDAQQAHERAVAAADEARRVAEQAAQAELARTGKAALADWTRAERDAQGVPGEAFVAKDRLGRFSVHASPGTPAAATAQPNGHGEWVVDSDTGRAFVGGSELAMRRALFGALMGPLADLEELEAAG